MLPTARMTPRQAIGASARKAVSYCSDVATLANIPLTVVPSEFTAVIISSAMPEAMSAYSMAVAPDPSATNSRMQFEKRCFTFISPDRRPPSPRHRLEGDGKKIKSGRSSLTWLPSTNSRLSALAEPRDTSLPATLCPNQQTPNSGATAAESPRRSRFCRFTGPWGDGGECRVKPTAQIIWSRKPNLRMFQLVSARQTVEERRSTRPSLRNPSQMRIGVWSIS